MKVLTLLLFITLLPTFAFAKEDGEKKKKFWSLDQGKKCKGKRKYPSEAGSGDYASKSECAAKLTCNAGYYKKGHKCKKEKKWVLYKNKSCKKKWTKDYQGQNQYDSKSACKSAELGEKVYYANSKGKCKKSYEKLLDSGKTGYSSKSKCKKETRGDKVYYVNSKGKCKKAYSKQLPEGVNLDSTFKSKRECKSVNRVYVVNSKGRCKKASRKEMEAQGKVEGTDFYKDKRKCKSDGRGDKVYYADSAGKCKKAYSGNLPQGVTLEQTFSKKRDCKKQNRVYVVNSKGRCKKASRKELESQGKVEGTDFYADKKKCKSDGRGDKVYYADSAGKCKKAYSGNLPEGVSSDQTFESKRDCKSKNVVYVVNTKGKCKKASRTELEGQGKKEGTDFYKDKRSCKSDGRGDKVYYADSAGKCKKAYSGNLPEGVSSDQTFESKRDCKSKNVVYVVNTKGKCKKASRTEFEGQGKKEGTDFYKDKRSCKSNGRGDKVYYADSAGKCKKAYSGNLPEGVSSDQTFESKRACKSKNVVYVVNTKGKCKKASRTELEGQGKKEGTDFYKDKKSCKSGLKDSRGDKVYYVNASNKCRKGYKNLVIKDGVREDLIFSKRKACRDHVKSNGGKRVYYISAKGRCKKGYDNSLPTDAVGSYTDKSTCKSELSKQRGEKVYYVNDSGKCKKGYSGLLAKSGVDPTKIFKRRRECKDSVNNVARVYYVKGGKCKSAKGRKADKLKESGVATFDSSQSCESVGLRDPKNDISRKIAGFRLTRSGCKPKSMKARKVDNKKYFDNKASCDAAFDGVLDENGVFKLSRNKCTRMRGMFAKKVKNKVGDGKYFAQRSQCEEALVKANEASGKNAVYVLENGRCRVTYSSRRVRYDNTSRFETEAACQTKAGEYTQQLAADGYQVDDPNLTDNTGRGLASTGADAIQGVGGDALGNASTVLGATPDAGALSGEGSAADAATADLQSRLAQQQAELEAAISPEQRECEAQEGKSWDASARRGKGKCISENRIARRNRRRARKCRSKIKKVMRRLAAGKIDLNRSLSILDRKGCSPEQVAEMNKGSEVAQNEQQ